MLQFKKYFNFNYWTAKLRNYDKIEKQQRNINELKTKKNNLENKILDLKEEIETLDSMCGETEKEKLKFKKELKETEEKLRGICGDSKYKEKILLLPKKEIEVLISFIPQKKSRNYKPYIKMSHPHEKYKALIRFFKKVNSIDYVLGVTCGEFKKVKLPQIKKITKDEILGIYPVDGLGHFFKVETTAKDIKEQEYIAKLIKNIWF